MLFYLMLLYGLCEGVNILEQKGCFEAKSLEEFYNIKNDLISFKILEGNDDQNKNKTSEEGVLSQITELAQFNEIPYYYIVIGEEGPAHKKTFTVTLHLGDEKYEGTGSSKKDANRDAAKKALAQTLYQGPSYVRLKPNTDTPTVQLNNLALKLGMAITYHLVEKIAGQGKKFISLDGNKINLTDLEYLSILKSNIDYRPKGPFTVRVTVGDDKQYFGLSHSIQDAKHDSAKNALASIDTEDNSCYQEGPASINCKILKDNLKSPISKLYELAEFHKFFVEYNIVKEYGPDHEKHFVTECRFGDFIVQGEGGSKKKSKTNAAENMLAKIELLGITHSHVMNNNMSHGKSKKKKKKQQKINAKSSLINYVDNIKESNSELQYDSDDKSNKRKNKKIKITKSPKSELMQVGKSIGIQVEFADLGQKQGKFYSVVFMGVDPWQLCVGDGETQQLSEASTALYALKYLYENTIFDKSIISEDVERLILDEELQYSLVYEEILS